MGTAEFYLRRPAIDTFTMVALGLEVVLGFLTFTGSSWRPASSRSILRERPMDLHEARTS